jgi:hypothetical protein
MPFLMGGGPTASGPVVYHQFGFGIGDGVPPLGPLLLFGDLAGDVGDDRTEPGQIARVVGESGQSGEIDMDVDSALSAPGMGGAFQEV